jgi:trans-aconitate 2-methyltransferase
MAEKDFGPIESDYAFFMSHATEAESDAAEYARELARFPEGRESIEWLDFGCGAGDFTERLALLLNWPPQKVRLTLIEPVRHQREEAARRLTQFSQHPIHGLEKLPEIPEPRFDLVLSNHVLYYVNDLTQTLDQLCGSLCPGGKLLLAMAGWDNALMQLWQIGFGMLGKPVPYFAAEDVETELSRKGTQHRKTKADYQLRFANTLENRLKILRFLFADHLQEMPTDRLLKEFDRSVRGDDVEVNTHSYHFTIERP